MPRLMVPGPVELDDSVLDALSSQVLPHAGVEFAEIYKSCLLDLKQLFGTNGKTFLLVSSGTGGIETALKNLFAAGDRVLVLRNGFFGDRLVLLAESLRLEVEILDGKWDTPISTDNVKKRLSEINKVKGLVAVHHETSTGQLNPIDEYGEVASDFGITYMVDAVSSLGFEEILMDKWGVDICVSVSNKGLEGPAGIAPIAVNNKAWDAIKSSPSELAGWYSNLLIWQNYFEKWNTWHPFPISMPTSVIKGFRVSLDLLMKETVQGRKKRYEIASNHLRNELGDIGVSGFGNPESRACSVSAFTALHNFSVDYLIRQIRVQCGIQIAGGLGNLEGKIFRVSHMGKASHPSYNDDLIAWFKSIHM